MDSLEGWETYKGRLSKGKRKNALYEKKSWRIEIRHACRDIFELQVLLFFFQLVLEPGPELSEGVLAPELQSVLVLIIQVHKFFVLEQLKEVVELKAALELLV